MPAEKNVSGRASFLPGFIEGENIRVALVIPTFRIGGAERQAFELASRLNSRRYTVTVIALRGEGELRDLFVSLPNLRVVALDAATRVGVFFKLTREILHSRVQVLHSFLTSANVYCLLSAIFLPDVKVVIGLRDSIPNVSCGSLIRWIQRHMLYFFVCRFHHLSDLFITNSEAGRVAYEKRFGILPVVIPNGIDTGHFKPTSTARDLLRRTVGGSVVGAYVGILANCSVYKDYPTFVRAAKLIAEEIPNVHFVSIGDDHTEMGPIVKDLVQQAGLQQVFHFLGTRQDVQQLVPGLDVLCSSSVTEGFSNAIAEAMACGVPCVVTDVGDSRRIVGDTGVVVARGNPDALAAGVIVLLRKGVTEKQRLSDAARQRVIEHFDAAEMARQHERLYESLLFERDREGEVINACDLTVSSLSERLTEEGARYETRRLTHIND